MKLGKYSLENRTYFDKDVEFPDTLSQLVNGYNDAAKYAALTAKHAARKGTRKSICKAQWWEAVTQTIEICLDVASDSESVFSMPDPPKFDSA